MLWLVLSWLIWLFLTSGLWIFLATHISPYPVTPHHTHLLLILLRFLFLHLLLHDLVCNEVWVDSFYLKNKFTNGYNIPVKQILPTYDERIFQKIPVKDKIENFVYYGLVSNKLDIPLLTKIAKKYNLYIAGPIEKGCELPEGAHYLGCFEQKELFEKVSEIADAFIIPYVGKNMEGVIPAKTTELMAMGLPVYISSFYDSRELSDIFYVYNNHDEIFNYIDSYSPEEFEIRSNKGLSFSGENKDTMLKSKVTLS